MIGCDTPPRDPTWTPPTGFRAGWIGSSGEDSRRASWPRCAHRAALSAAIFSVVRAAQDVHITWFHFLAAQRALSLLLQPHSLRLLRRHPVKRVSLERECRGRRGGSAALREGYHPLRGVPLAHCTVAGRECRGGSRPGDTHRQCLMVHSGFGSALTGHSLS